MTDAAAATPNEGQGGAKAQVVAYTEKSQDKHESRHIQLVREYGFHPRSKVSVEDGALLPKKFEPFPQNMYGKPLEEIDNFIYEETFCVVSKRFRKNYIHRFTGTKSLFWFTPWSATRRACVYLATNQFFDYLVMATILFNCVFLAMTETVEEAEYIFLVIYTCEMVIKIIAKGFVLNKYTYLRNPWNWLDFVVITSGYATIGMEVGNLAGLRTFRVLRALKTISIMPGLKTIINALLHSFKQLAEVMTLTIFCLMVFALFALQVYMGELRNKCVKVVPEGWNVTYLEWRTWINDTENWIYDEDGVPVLCGNLTGARHCPKGFVCLRIGENPNHGYTNFDNFMWSMLTTFQLITLDYWENVYNMILATSGPMSVSFFTVVVFFGSFYLINLMLAVVALSYEEESQITLEERKKDLLDHRDDSTFSFDPSNLNVKKLNKHQRKKIDARKGVLLASYSRKKTRRRKKVREPGISNVIGGNESNCGSLIGSGNSNNGNQSKNPSLSPSPNPSPRQSCVRPQALALQRTRGYITTAPVMSATIPGGDNNGVKNTNTQNPNTLHPLDVLSGVNYRGQLLPSSRQASSNASEGGVNRESSLDDSGVVDDHYEQDLTAGGGGSGAGGIIVNSGVGGGGSGSTGTELVHATTVELQGDVTPVTLALSPGEVRIIKCNGNIACLKEHEVYTLHHEYLSQIVVLDDLPDRNCDKCVQCCVDYEGWLQFQNSLYKMVKDPIFELAITLCIVLNTMFLAIEHHGMSETVRQSLDIGNKVFTSVFTFECILKLMALSKDFFLCGWNIFDLIIVSASLLDIIFELVDGLSVLRGLRLLRVLKLAQSWTTMKVLLSIIISTIGALGNLTLVLVIVIYIFAVIGMQLFSKDYTPDKFYPDPVPRWNFNDFFHSFMMIFRILCGEWIEPLWDCMRAEEKEGASTCFAIFLPTLVMGNFMVLNLFLALLLNSFNSEELKSKKEEVGEDSKLARSFERIRDLVRKKRMANKEKTENEANTKLEKLVNEVIIRRRNEKQKLVEVSREYGATLFPQQTNIYRHSYQFEIENYLQESMNRPVSCSDFGREIPLKDKNGFNVTNFLMSGSQETVREMDDRQLQEDPQNNDETIPLEKERTKVLLKQMSSGFGTQQNDSKEEPTLTESIELQTITVLPANSSGTINKDGDDDDEFGQNQPLLENIQKPPQLGSYQRLTNENLQYYGTLNRRSSIKSADILQGIGHLPNIDYIKSQDQHLQSPEVKRSCSINMPSISRIVRRSPSYHKSMNRLPSDLSINTLSNDQDELLDQSNLRDELLNCEQKELFQFLNEDFDNSNNYFSDTVGYSNALIDPETDSLIYDSNGKKDETSRFSPLRKISSGSLKSNFSNISNSIFQTLEMKRGGSISGSIDKLTKRHSDYLSSMNCDDDKEPLVKHSEFEDIIQNFDKEMTEIKNQTSKDNYDDPSIKSSMSDPVTKLSESASSQTITPGYDGVIMRHKVDANGRPRRPSSKFKRRSLEKQKPISDDEYSLQTEIRKICDQMQTSATESMSDYSLSSPKLRHRTDFHSSFDRIKRTSLIERVEEVAETGEHHHSTVGQQPLTIESEKLPRKLLNLHQCFETASLKSSGSDQQLGGDSWRREEDKKRKSTNKIDDNPDLPVTPAPPPKKTVTLKGVEIMPCKPLKTKRSFTDVLKSPLKSSQKKDGVTQRPWHALVSYVDDLTVGGRRNSHGEYEDPTSFPSFGNAKPAKIPQDCFPQRCYTECPCWNKCIETKFGGKWTGVRSAVLSVVDTPAFEWFVLVLIFASSITLCFEDIHLDNNIALKRILYWTNFGFCVIFIIEMVLKWLALGFTKYFSSFWTILDFIIVFVSVFSLLIEENENLRVLRSLRTLRALRPLRAISRWQGMRIVVNALMYAIPSIFNVLLVCLVFWLIFSIMGVQFFGGKFFKCVDENGELLETTIVNDRWQCMALNYSWINSKITFDHVGMGYLALLQVATFEGWMEVMADAVDARGVDLQPQREANLYAYIYFVIFIVCGSFFTLNLFIGVIIDNFNMLKKKYEGGVLEMFLTESQKHYYTAMKKLGRKKPQKVIKRPINHFLAMFYDLSNSRRFEIAIFVLIFLNMLTMGIEHYNQPHAVFFILEVSNAFFTTVFGLEACVKIVGLRYHYFTVPWNVFDFLLVLASILGILMEDIMIDLPVSPTLLRVVRVFRIGRILRLIKAAKGIRKLLFALVVSLPALFNIGALLALITFIYAILGMSIFGHVRLQGALDDMVNFQTFGRSMQLLFRLMTSAGWNDVLESLMIQPPDCNIEYNHQQNGDCGHPLLAITYFTSFIIISYMIVINMYIAIILENFNQAHQEEEIGIVEDDLEMFYIRWSKYDPHATQFIPFSQLSDFIASLDPPLGIQKPNTVALVSFNLPISKGNKIHCLDILHALVKHVLGHVEETDNFKQLQEQMDIKFKKQFPTRKELEIVSSTRIWKRQDKAAKLIQNAWKEYLRLKRERERSPMSLEDENTQTSSPGGWQSKLSALNFLHLQVHRRGTATSSRASSRKSSRASDASDLSELAGPWLNLPLMLVGGTNDLNVVKNGDFDFKRDCNLLAGEHQQLKPIRRRSFYNFFLRHQDAVDDALTSPSVQKRGKSLSVISPSGTILSIASEVEPKPKPPPTTPKSKRATSFIKKKPPLERGLSAQSALRLNKNAFVSEPPTTSGADVSILVTQPSPEAPIGPPVNRLHSESTLVHVLVHRESEEYQTDLDDGGSTASGNLCEVKVNKPPDIKLSSGINNDLNLELKHPYVTIRVDSPKETPTTNLYNITPIHNDTIISPTLASTITCSMPEHSIMIDINEPIDVNLSRDTTNIFYDYDLDLNNDNNNQLTQSTNTITTTNTLTTNGTAAAITATSTPTTVMPQSQASQQSTSQTEQTPNIINKEIS